MTATDINSAYAAHLATIAARTNDALAACGYDALVIFSGHPPNHFLDDFGWPFKVNPHFKLWTPLQEAADCWIVYRPSQPLKLVFLQPLDYWYKPPETPSDFWTSQFEIEIIREADDAKDLRFPR